MSGSDSGKWLKSVHIYISYGKIKTGVSLFLDHSVYSIKVKGLNIYIAPLTGKPEQQRFTMRSGVLTSTCSRRRGAISNRPLPERTDFGPAVAARQTHLCPSQPHYGIHRAMLSGKDSLFIYLLYLC